MTKMSIADAAEYFGVSKEAIHNRVRRGSLVSEIVDGEKYVSIDKKPQNTTRATTKKTVRPKTNIQSDDRYYKLLELQNSELKAKVTELEGETKNLRDQKELMLIQERQKIEQIYRDKDEQLKNILNAISTKFMLESPSTHVEAEIEDIVEVEEPLPTKLTPLNKYLKQRNFSKKKRHKIRSKFEKNSKNDNRIIKLNKKFYIDLEKHDYSDYSL